MTNPTYGAANLQWLGVARETSYGTAEATPTLYVPVDTPVWTHPTAKLTDTALDGSMGTDRAQVNGMRYDQVTFKTNCYIDSAYFFFRSALGIPDVITGSADPYTHKTSLQSANNGQPAGTTVFWYDAQGKVQQMPGAQISSLKATFKTDGLVELDVTYIGLPATAITPPTNTPSTAVPMPGWNTTITVGGTALTQYSDIDFEIKRATEMIPTLTGTQSPFAIFCGPASVTGNFTGVYQGTTDVLLVDEIANTQPAVTVKTAPVGDATHYLMVQMSQVAFDSADPSGTNKWMEIKAAFKAIKNATDPVSGGSTSPMQVELLSPASTGI